MPSRETHRPLPIRPTRSSRTPAGQAAALTPTAPTLDLLWGSLATVVVPAVNAASWAPLATRTSRLRLKRGGQPGPDPAGVG